MAEVKELKVLDKGFVRLVDFMGDDARIVQSARVSYGTGTKSFREDSALIDYLLRNGHTSPFEQVVFTFHCKMPIFVARQWVRHRTARINEISGRYSVMQNEFYLPAVEDLAYQSSNNKQGRGAQIESSAGQVVRDTMEELQQESYHHYRALIDDNVAKEIARMNLPLSLYTEWYWQMDLNNLFHFLRLRLDSHAQKEIRVYAEAILSLISELVPAAVAAFKKHILYAVTLNSDEVAALKTLLKSDNLALDEKIKEQLKQKLNL